MGAITFPEHTFGSMLRCKERCHTTSLRYPRRQSHCHSPTLMQAAVDRLSEYDHWVVWRYEDRGGAKPTKPPYDPSTGKKASTADPITWGSWHHATEVSQQGYEGVGFVLTNCDPYIALDRDGCLDSDSAFATHRSVDEIIELFDSYTEISPSGRGIRIIVEGEWPQHLKHKIQGEWGDNFEIYSSGRYVTLTGGSYHSTPKPIRNGQSGLDQLMALFTDTQKAAPRHQHARDKTSHTESRTFTSPVHDLTLGRRCTGAAPSRLESRPVVRNHHSR
jgi:primase-polymerase (primpol)-like protein